MKLITREEFTTVTLTETFDLGNGLVFTVITANGKRIDQTIRRKNHGVDEEYFYFNNVEEFLHKLRITPFNESDSNSKHGYWFYGYVDQDPFTTISKEGVNMEKIIMIDGSSHTFRNSKNEYIPQCIVLDYIGGFKELDPYRRYDWEPLKAHLKAHPQVIEVSEFPIPHYNADFGGQRGLRVKLTMLPEWRVKGKQSWCEENGIFSENDPLGIKKFRINS